ncbi:DNA repair protein RecN [bacterium]|nr:DNA repair protein RecN [bacterium]
MYLTRLRIKDLALVSLIDVEFPKGIVAITGETGAGKSTVMGSIQLLLGERADVSQIRHGSPKAVVEGVFEFERGRDEGMIDALKKDGFDVSLEEPLIVRREIGSNGRGAAFFADQMISVKRLGELMAETVDIHSQNAQQSLTKRNWQRVSFDHYAGADSLAGEVAALYFQSKALKEELEEHRSKERELLRLEELWRFQVEEVSRAQLREGEEEELLEQEKSLSHAEEIRELLFSLEESLGDEEGSPFALLKQTNRSLKQLAGLYAPAESWEEEFLNVIGSLEELKTEASRASDKLNADPEELNRVQERLALIGSLKKKYGASVKEVLEETEKIRVRLSEGGSFDERKEKLEKQLSEIQKELKDKADKLSRIRAKAALPFSKSVEAEIAPLGMGGMRFKVELEKQDEPQSNGNESVEFMIANVGQPFMSLQKIASGGELSRLTLALKCLSLGGNAVQILFFDEIDSGISATVAGAIGKRMRLLGKEHQVFVITHMPVIAACGDVQYSVEKSVERNDSFVGIKRLEKGARKAELARMLGGNEKEALSYAAKLLSKNWEED